MQKERFYIYLPSDFVNDLRQFAGERQSLSQVGEELLRLGLSLKRGETIEAQSLPVIRQIVSHELSLATDRLRAEIRDDLKSNERRLGDRLAGLMVRSVKEILIARRMLYSLFGKSY